MVNAADSLSFLTPVEQDDRQNSQPAHQLTAKMSALLFSSEQRLRNLESGQRSASARVVDCRDQREAFLSPTQLANPADVYRGITGGQHRHRVDALGRRIDHLEMGG